MMLENARLVIHYYDVLRNLLKANPESERAQELRRMVKQLEAAQPELEKERINEMRRKLRE